MAGVQTLLYIGSHLQRNDHMPCFVHDTILNSHGVMKIPIAAHHLWYMRYYQWLSPSAMPLVPRPEVLLSHICNSLVTDMEMHSDSLMSCSWKTT